MAEGQTVVGVVVASCRADLSRTLVEPEILRNPAVHDGAFEVALHHGLGGLFYRQFIDSGQASRSECFRSAALAEAGHSYRMADELVELQDLFRDHSIEMVSFKGPVLASRAYPRLSDRGSVDLDILIRPADLTRAANLLMQNGYTIKRSDAALDDLLDRPYQYHASFVRNSGTLVELHWAFNAVLHGTFLDTEGMLRRAQPVAVLGSPVMSLTVEDTLLHLCVHGFRHRWSMLKWLADLAYILRGKEQVDWTTLEREARQVGCYRMVLLGFGLAHDLLGASLPDPILYRIHKDNIVQKLISIHRPALLHNRPLTNLDAMRCEIRGRERFRDHFKASWGVLSRIFRLTSEDLPPGASMQMKAKAILWRPVRLCRDFGWKWLRDVFELH